MAHKTRPQTCATAAQLPTKPLTRQSVDGTEDGGVTANEPRWPPERQGLQDSAQLPTFTTSVLSEFRSIHYFYKKGQ